jgi:hypothetical protein
MTSSHRPFAPLAACLVLAAIAVPTCPAAVEQRVPVHRAERLITASDAEQEFHYLAFPAVLDTGTDVLVSYKRARAHARDAGSSLEMVRIDKASGKVTQPMKIAHAEGRIMQMGEWVRFPNGDIANYIDVQQPVAPARTGLSAVRSRDGGRNFGPLERVGEVEGTEFGYPFGFLTEGGTTWMMAMTFSNLRGGHSIHPPRPEAGPVWMLRSENNGKTWKPIRNLTEEFGSIPINESAFVRHGAGFLVATRGYDNRARLHLTDGEFKVQRQSDLTEKYPFIESYIGRPRLFSRDGRFYLIGRNWTQATAAPTGTPTDGVPNFPAAMKMCLFRVDPSTLEVVSWSILDNADGRNVTDAYYPAPYFVDRDGETFLKVVDYKGLDRKPPQIVEFEFKWSEVR